MTTQEKTDFVKTLINMVRADILTRIDSMPGTWDGVELRQYIADSYQSCIWGDILTGKRKKDYKNTLLVNGRL